MRTRSTRAAKAYLGLLFALALFALGIMTSIFAVNLYIAAVPMRALLILASLAVAVLSSWQDLWMALRHCKKLLAVIAAVMMLGIFVSLLNGAAPAMMLKQIIEIHLQAVVGLILAALLIEHFGPQAIVEIFLLAWAFSAIIAIAQASGFEPAWQLRAWLGDLMNDPAITKAFYSEQKRALGLSFTPVHLASQTCLAFAAFFAHRYFVTSGAILNRLDGPLIITALIMILVCIASGNRSPLLGFAVFLALYIIIVSPRLMLIFAPVILLASAGAVELFSVLGDSGARIASTSDGSATGRLTLSLYGLRLFLDQPWGYGLLFESTNLSGAYSQFVAGMENPAVIKHFALHNYFLQMLNKYGILLLFLIPLLIPRSKAVLTGWFAFLPYIIHITFHNEGPLTSDFMF